MQTIIKTTVILLGVVGILGSASADVVSIAPNHRALHLAIALQGDQALVTIRSASQAAISSAIQMQMDNALPRDQAASDMATVHPDSSGKELVAVVADF